MKIRHEVAFLLKEEKQYISQLQEIINSNDFINLAAYPLLYAVWERVIKRSINYIVVDITKKEDLYINDLDNDLQKYITAKVIVSNKNKYCIDIKRLSLSSIKLERLLESNIDVKLDSLANIAKYYQYFGLDLHNRIADQSYHVPIYKLCKLRHQIAHGQILSINDKNESDNLKSIIDTLLQLLHIIEDLTNKCCDDDLYLKN